MRSESGGELTTGANTFSRYAAQKLQSVDPIHLTRSFSISFSVSSMGISSNSRSGRCRRTGSSSTSTSR